MLSSKKFLLGLVGLLVAHEHQSLKCLLQNKLQRNNVCIFCLLLKLLFSQISFKLVFRNLAELPGCVLTIFACYRLLVADLNMMAFLMWDSSVLLLLLSFCFLCMAPGLFETRIVTACGFRVGFDGVFELLLTLYTRFPCMVNGIKQGVWCCCTCVASLGLGMLCRNQLSSVGKWKVHNSMIC